jgi:hypothetical protein
MIEGMRAAGVLVGVIFGALFGAVVLSGCAQAPADVPQTSAPQVDAPAGDGAPNYADNHRYAERIDPDPEALATAVALIDPVTAALQPLAGGASGAVPVDAVRAALLGAGVPDNIQTDAGSGVAFGADVGGACLFGGVGPNGVEVEAGGYIRDGGCLVISGH